MFATFSTEMQNIFPNKSSVKVFRDMKTNEIFWEDRKHLVSPHRKEDIEYCLRSKGEEMSKEMSNCLFSFLFDSYQQSRAEARPFFKKLMTALAKNVDVQKAGKFDQTPLMLACKIGAEEAVSKLLERGANMEAVDGYGSTALSFASEYGNEPSCKLLLRNGANVNARDENGNSVINCAAQQGKAEIMKTLLQFGANSKIEDKRGRAALHYAKTDQNCAKVIEEHEAFANLVFKKLSDTFKNVPKSIFVASFLIFFLYFFHSF
jgi:hypothetical protein